MKCPQCESEESRVIHTIPVEHITWRERVCKHCDHRWWTSECEDEPLEGMRSEHTANTRG